MRKNYGKFLGCLALCATLLSVSNIAWGQTLTVSMSNQTICLGDSAMLTVTGTPPFDIQFSTTRNGLSTGQFNRHIEAGQINGNGEVFLPSEDTGTYVFTLISIMDANDTNSNLTLSATVRVNDLPTVSMRDTTLCLGGSAEIGLTGVAPFEIKFKTKKDGAWVGGSNESTATVFTRQLSSTEVTNGKAYVSSMDYGVFEFHLLSVEDANCINTSLVAMATVTVSALPTVQMTGLIGGKDTICLGESKELLFTGVAPFDVEFTSSKNNGVTETFYKNGITSTSELIPSLEAGDFKFMLVSLTDSNGCKADLSNITDNIIEAEITVKALPTVLMTELVNGKDTICLGESKELVFTGVAPFNIEFSGNGTIDRKSNILTNTFLVPSEQTGAFSFKLINLTDASGCSYDALKSTDTVDIFVRELPTVTLTHNQSITIGDSVNLMTLTGEAPWSVVYNDGTRDITLSVNVSPYVFIPNAVDTYTFKLASVSDANSCTDLVSGSVTIIVNPVAGKDASLMSLSVSKGTLTPVFDKNVLNYTVNVTHEIDSIAISAQATDPKATITGTGRFPLIIGTKTFPVIVRADDGTTVKTYIVKVTRAGVGIEEIDISENISLYPNPTQDLLRIVSDLQIKQIEIHDVNGKLVKQIINPKQTISIAELPKGIYMLQIQTAKGIAIKKIMRQ
jgi:hypothetical protein